MVKKTRNDWKQQIVKWMAILFLLVLLPGIRTEAAEEAVVLPTENVVKTAVTVETTQEGIDALLRMRAKHQEKIFLHLNPEKVKLFKTFGDSGLEVSETVQKAFHYGWNGGLYNAVAYSVFGGPSSNVVPCMRGGEESTSMVVADPEKPGYYYACLQIDYHETDAELAKCDAKIDRILSGLEGRTDAQKVKYIWDYLKRKLPDAKESAVGYPRNCNGVYGALFGDGTGYVCATYACTFQRFMERAGIKSYIISGEYMRGEPCHAYNVIRVGRKWYVLDYTASRFMQGKEDYRGSDVYEGLVQHYMKGYTMAETSLKVTQPTVSTIKKGTVKTISGAQYKVTSVKNGSRTVAYYKAPAAKTAVIVPSTVKINNVSYKVTSIGTGAFKNRTKLRSVLIGKNVTVIGANAFYGCNRLTKLILRSEKISYIGTRAFYRVYKYAKFYVPKAAKAQYTKRLTAGKGFKKSMKIIGR